MIGASDRRRLTADEFNRIAEIGIFAADECVELVEGALVSYAPPQGPLHAGAVCGFMDVIRARLGEGAMLWIQLPIVMSDMSELEPDLAVLSVREGRYRRALPRAPDVIAAIEVADSSFAADRTKKLRAYAVSGICEYWIVDLRRDRIEIYREPRGDEYGSYRLALRSDTVSFAAFPDIAFSVDELLG